jgi:hypothetical protein
MMRVSAVVPDLHCQLLNQIKHTQLMCNSIRNSSVQTMRPCKRAQPFRSNASSSIFQAIPSAHFSNAFFLFNGDT